MSYTDDTFTDEDLGKALLLKDDIERKNIKNYNNLNNKEKEYERLEKSCKYGNCK